MNAYHDFMKQQSSLEEQYNIDQQNLNNIQEKDKQNRKPYYLFNNVETFYNYDTIAAMSLKELSDNIKEFNKECGSKIKYNGISDFSPIFTIQKYYRANLMNWQQPPTFAKLIVDFDTALINNINKIAELENKAIDPMDNLLKEITRHDKNMTTERLNELISKFNSVQDQLGEPNDYVLQGTMSKPIIKTLKIM